MVKFVLIYVESNEAVYLTDNSYSASIYDSKEEAVEAMKKMANKHINEYLEYGDDERFEVDTSVPNSFILDGLAIIVSESSIRVVDDSVLSNHYHGWEWVIEVVRG